MDQILSIRCALPGIEEPAIITAQVKSLERENQSVTIGASFDDIPPEVHDMLTNLISSIQKVT
jgi:hypothetical protein